MTNSTNNLRDARLQNARKRGYTRSIFAFDDFATPGTQFEVNKIKNFGSISYFYIEFEKEVPMSVVKLIKMETDEYVALTPEANTTEGDMVAPITIFKWSRPSAKLTVLTEEEFTATLPGFID